MLLRRSLGLAGGHKKRRGIDLEVWVGKGGGGGWVGGGEDIAGRRKACEKEE